MDLCANLEVYILEVDFLNKLFLFKLRSILEVCFISKKSRSTIEVLLKYKQSTFLFYSVFILHLYFFLGSSLKHSSIGLQGSEVYMRYT